MIADTLLDFHAGARLYLAGGGVWASGSRSSRPGHCRVRVFAEHDPEMDAPRTFVLATDVEDNPGPSVTNAIGDIAAHVCAAFSIDPFRLVLIEHYDDRQRVIAFERTYEHEQVRDLPGRTEGESFDLVHLPWNGRAFGAPQWLRVTKGEVEEMIGEKLP